MKADSFARRSGRGSGRIALALYCFSFGAAALAIGGSAVYQTWIHTYYTALFITISYAFALLGIAAVAMAFILFRKALSGRKK